MILGRQMHTAEPMLLRLKFLLKNSKGINHWVFFQNLYKQEKNMCSQK